MKRIDRIYNFLLNNSYTFSKNDILNYSGFTAQSIGESLDILRNNVSKDLNLLCRDKKLIKIKNRPVLYFPRTYIQNIFSIKIPKSLEEITDINLLNCSSKVYNDNNSPFNYLIGYNTSLKNQIEQAKAAIMYPPNGLHTLIIGSTGVGKSLFAKIMYQYAKFIKKLPENAPFIVFNCADYANNPQLLLSHIFGHVKGAFTGADKETEGIVAKADGGILFLDEIHRLPPQGQEMIFYFMDTFSYSKMGETERNRKANVLLICATTENPDSSLLHTFIRRIPITISIPNFEERPLEDKIKLIEFLISKEAQRVNKNIKISSDAIKALIGSTSYGNIGQLKSNIQLICAKGFLNCINSPNDGIELEVNTLPSNIKNGLMAFTNKYKNINFYNVIPNSIVVNPDGNKEFIDTDSYEPDFNIYSIIQDKTSALKDEGMSDEEIKKFISTDINVHLKQFYDRFKNDTQPKNKLMKIVDKDIIEFSEKIKELAEKRLNKKLNEKFIYAISLHFSALFKRIKNKSPNLAADIDITIPTDTIEFNIAKEIHTLTEKRYNIAIPDIEIEYMSLLLSSIQETDNQKRIGIIVAEHGRSTATSMVNVAKDLFNIDNIRAVDMPLDKNSSDILNEVIINVKEINEGKGVLLLVDMGSLNTFADVITEKTGIKTKSIDMVSTPLVLEAARKCSLCDSDLSSVYLYLIKDFRGYTNKFISYKQSEINNNIIITVCSTGQGAAEKLKELVQDILSNNKFNNIKIMPVSLLDFSDTIKKLSNSYNIICIVGVKNPNLGIPFISIQSLISGSGEIILKNIIEGNPVGTISKSENTIVLDNLCKQSLNEILTYLNPDKIYPLLINFIKDMEQNLNTSYDNSTKLRIILHLACALERMILHDGLIYKSPIENLDKKIINAITHAGIIFKNSLSITLTNDEIYYMTELFKY